MSCPTSEIVKQKSLDSFKRFVESHPFPLDKKDFPEADGLEARCLENGCTFSDLRRVLAEVKGWD